MLNKIHRKTAAAIATAVLTCKQIFPAHLALPDEIGDQQRNTGTNPGNRTCKPYGPVAIWI